MKANPDKFQAICTGNKTHAAIKSFKIDTTVINCEDSVTVFGVNIDFQLSFTEHISESKKAFQQLAVLKRIGRFLLKAPAYAENCRFSFINSLHTNNVSEFLF